HDHSHVLNRVAPVEVQILAGGRAGSLCRKMNSRDLSTAVGGHPLALPRSGANAVTIRNVSFSYGSHRVLEDFSLDILAGELLTVLGPSGSGKSTVLNLLVGVSTPDSGSITMADRELTRVAIAKRNIGYVFQNYALFPHMS